MKSCRRFSHFHYDFLFINSFGNCRFLPTNLSIYGQLRQKEDAPDKYSGKKSGFSNLAYY